ncbi:complement component C9 [Xyrauchen texanus]|uniref:complement component C9 n=1 Tax=Xyrauchen texanus TaxID=154827 RepID=UPI002242BFFA|nr:complement component C9 [Xyrauchen texanus]
MMALTALCVMICILYKADGMSIKDNMQGSTRVIREINAPAQINCKMSAWSQWIPCDPCTNTTHRSRGIEVFGQFKGVRCIEPIGDRKHCIATTQCQMDPPPVCKSTQWKCASGLCINKNLMCNGDYDCSESDLSDEEDCDIIRAPCGKSSPVESDIASKAGYGINILGSDPRMNPFNNRFYNGQCNRIRDPTTLEYNRLPWNVGVLSYETKVEESSSKEVYEDIHSLIREITTETSFGVDMGLNFKITLTEHSGAGEGDDAAGNGFKPSISGGISANYEKTKIIKELSEYTEIKRKSFMRVKGKVQLATYRMRQRGLEVTPTFLDDVDALPLKYEKGQYFSFLEDYGTHFTKNGRSGGEYELVYIMNEDVVKQKQVSEKMLKDCFEFGIKADFQLIKDVGIEGHVKPNYCKSVNTKPTDEKTKKGLIDKVLISVSGGSSESAVAMKSQLTKEGILDYTQYVNWAKTISLLPALIHSDPEPIYNAIPLDFPDAQPRRDNLRRALDDYVAEYSVCKCQPCQNGGTVMQIDGDCKCMCSPGTEGVACQIIDTELAKGKAFEQLGNWGCWSAWSICTGGRHTRSRSCNSQGVQNGICKGDTVNEEYC